MPSLIESIKKSLSEGKVARTTVRDLLRDFGAQRRRANIVETIRSTLANEGLMTEPDFTNAWIDAEIQFFISQETPFAAKASDQSQIHADLHSNNLIFQEPKEARQLIRMLNAANRGVMYVSPDDNLEKALTMMLANDYSQLPIMTGPRDIKGVISWKSIGGRLAQGISLTRVADAMEPAIIVKETDSLFEVTARIISDEFVFVASHPDNKIVGIVTATDLSEQFQTLSSPFLLIGQIENQIRNLLSGKFDILTLQSACNETDPERKKRVNSIADLTFGEYVRLIEEKDNFVKLGINIDRKAFVSEMDSIREIRNDVMHFDPDGIENSELARLQRFSRFLTELERLSRRQLG